MLDSSAPLVVNLFTRYLLLDFSLHDLAVCNDHAVYTNFTIRTIVQNLITWL